MREEIPVEYPSDIPDEQLLDYIKRYSKYATSATRAKNVVYGSSYWKEMVALGQSEINNRVQSSLLHQLENLTKETNVLRQENKISSKINLMLAIVTIILACISGYLGDITLDYSQESGYKDSTWKREQSELLIDNNNILTEIKVELQRIDSLSLKSELTK